MKALMGRGAGVSTSWLAAQRADHSDQPGVVVKKWKARKP